MLQWNRFPCFLINLKYAALKANQKEVSLFLICLKLLYYSSPIEIANICSTNFNIYITFTGFPSIHCFTLSNTIAALFSRASFVAKATWGVAKRLGAPKSG